MLINFLWGNAAGAEPVFGGHLRCLQCMCQGRPVAPSVILVTGRLKTFKSLVNQSEKDFRRYLLGRLFNKEKAQDKKRNKRYV